MPKRLRDARDEAIARAYATDNHSSLRLGQYFDGRDHATILEAVDRAYRRGVR
jgi:chromosomal replication initiation ATPase DnaA